MQKYLQHLLNEHIDSLILGCTHYGLIEEKIKKHLPASVTVISQATATAMKLGDYLDRHPESETKLSKQSKRSYLATDLSQRYEKLTKLFLGDHFTEDARLQLVTL